MANKKRPHGLTIGGRFTPILCELQDSQAYLELSGNAAKLLPFLIRTARVVAVKTGAGSELLPQFDFTYSEAKRRGHCAPPFT